MLQKLGAKSQIAGHAPKRPSAEAVADSRNALTEVASDGVRR
jgi:hypothetical protein